MSDFHFISMKTRIVRGHKNIVFIYPVITAEVPRSTVEIFSVELDHHELVPSARADVKPGLNTFELTPATIVNPRGPYLLTVRHHPSIGECRDFDLNMEL